MPTKTEAIVSKIEELEQKRTLIEFAERLSDDDDKAISEINHQISVLEKELKKYES